ncbi:MAG: Qat anti-phage system QueC-like protein QatC [Anaerovoracaceae bacterium]
MSKYKLIGDYNSCNISAEKSGTTVIMHIPFMSEKGSFQYIDKILDHLMKNGIYPSEEGLDMLALATLVYLADTRISRARHAEDSWTREIALELPVFNLDKWLPQVKLFSQMLNFLTGDRWEINFVKREISLAQDETHKTKYDAVSLFSGGMDSLIGTINHLEQKHRVALISHAGDGYTKDAQKSLLVEFQNKYPNITPTYFNLWLSFKKDILLEGGTENSTRSRSFLFISFGVFVLSGMDEINVLQVPENGLIALNVPLDTLRVGSHSTRTTHPFYMNLWNKVLSELGLPYAVHNPYWNRTKGEMANECLNKDFLLEIINKSSSCSSPQKARWSGLPSQHCGYCVPCLIRRAAMHKAYGFENDTTTYSENSIKEIILAHAKRKGEQLRSFQFSIERVKDNPNLKNILIYKGGKLDGGDEYIHQLADVYYRGLMEVDNFILAHLEHEENRADK